MMRYDKLLAFNKTGKMDLDWKENFDRGKSMWNEKGNFIFKLSFIDKMWIRNQIPRINFIPRHGWRSHWRINSLKRERIFREKSENLLKVCESKSYSKGLKSSLCNANEFHVQGFHENIAFLQIIQKPSICVVNNVTDKYKSDSDPSKLSGVFCDVLTKSLETSLVSNSMLSNKDRFT